MFWGYNVAEEPARTLGIVEKPVGFQLSIETDGI